MKLDRHEKVGLGIIVLVVLFLIFGLGPAIAIGMEGWPANKADADLIRAELPQSHINPIDGSLISTPTGSINPGNSWVFKYYDTDTYCNIWRWSKLAHDIDTWKLNKQYETLGMSPPKQ